MECSEYQTVQMGVQVEESSLSATNSTSWSVWRKALSAIDTFL